MGFWFFRFFSRLLVEEKLIKCAEVGEQGQFVRVLHLSGFQEAGDAKFFISN